MDKIKHVYYDKSQSRGCSTCDYGANYYNDIDIVYESGIKMHIEIDTSERDMWLTEADMMIILGNSNTIDELIDNLKEHYKEWKDNKYIDATVYYTIGDSEPYYIINI